jgi:hypothetical protein
VKLSRLSLWWLAAVWFVVVLYPDPSVIIASVRQTVHPNIDPNAVRALAAKLPNDPRLIEAAVLNRIVPYAYDWQWSGVPWYFPTTAQVLQAGRGNCQGRAVLLASILKAKGIPFQLRMSFDHIWVQYPGKQANALENNNVLFAVSKHGHFVLQWPKNFHLGAEINTQIGQYWTPMPLLRKMLLLGGLAAIILLNALSRWGWRRAGFDAEGILLAPAAQRRGAVLPLPARDGSVGAAQPVHGR